MRQRGFTLVELVVSGGIFASVLLMAFTTLAAVNRMQRQVRVQRATFGAAQTTYQTLSQFARYAQLPSPGDTAASCSLNDPATVGAISSPVFTSTSAAPVVVQSPPARVVVWMVVRDLAVTSRHKVMAFVLAQPDAAGRYDLFSVRFTASSSGCVADAGGAASLIASSNMRVRYAPPDPFPFQVNTASAVIVNGVPDSGALSSVASGYGVPWRLQLRLNLVPADGSNLIIPVYGQVVSRLPQQVISNP